MLNQNETFLSSFARPRDSGPKIAKKHTAVVAACGFECATAADHAAQVTALELVRFACTARPEWACAGQRGGQRCEADEEKRLHFCSLLWCEKDV